MQVAQIVCVVGWAEPGQHQQQQSLHRHRSALPAPLFRPSCSSFCTGVRSSSIHITPHPPPAPPPPLPPMTPKPGDVDPRPPPPLSLPVFFTPETLSGPSLPVPPLPPPPAPPSCLYLYVSGSVAGCSLVISAAEARGPVARG